LISRWSQKEAIFRPLFSVHQAQKLFANHPCFSAKSDLRKGDVARELKICDNHFTKRQEAAEKLKIAFRLKKTSR
jgi:hypothetical protein